MPLTTFRFFIFAVIVIIFYFIVPKKVRWIILLVSSLAFYTINSIENCVFILITATSAFLSARWMDSESTRCRTWIKKNKNLLSDDERKAYKRKSNSRRKTILVFTLILNFGLLVFFKYSNFLISQINLFLNPQGSELISSIDLLIPMGISFYTFTTMGYLIDVYWEKTQSQHNYFKLLLFSSFFPQILQGPISNYRQLGKQLYEGHSFDYTAFKWGFQRFMWGLLKKLAISNVASIYIKSLFENYSSYAGLSVFLGILLYAVYIYADFSGYMDMVCGLCQILGIELAENFIRPYFSKSVAEYWRRWHITLGDWFKNYIYYPISMSKSSRKLVKAIKKKTNRRTADAVPSTIALIVTWFVTGLWHGASWGYIIWGLLNGFFLILQIWLDPFYALCRSRFHIRDSSLFWRIFRILRTFILISFIKILPEAGSLQSGVGLWKSVFTGKFLPSGLRNLLPFIDTGNYPYMQEVFYFCVMCFLILIMFVFSLIQRKHPVRESFNRIPMVIRIIILAAVFVVAFEIGATSTGLNGAFLYEQF